MSDYQRLPERPGAIICLLLYFIYNMPQESNVGNNFITKQNNKISCDRQNIEFAKSR